MGLRNNIMIKYITKPPKVLGFLDVPPFIARRYNFFDKRFIEKLIAWSVKEYYDMIAYLYSVDNMETARILENGYTNVDFLANCKSFHIVCNNMKPEIWNTLDKDTKAILIKARNILAKSL